MFSLGTPRHFTNLVWSVILEVVVRSYVRSQYNELLIFWIVRNLNDDLMVV